MELIFWTIVFIASLALLIKGADWFVEGSEKLGLIAGLSPFVIGVTIVALGTSLPELSAALFAVFRNATEIVTANAVGSNIANILLIVGISALATRRLVITRSLIDVDLPLFLVASVLFLGVAWDGLVVWQEGVLLLAAFLVYFIYSILQRRGQEEAEEVSILPAREMRSRQLKEKQEAEIKTKFNWKIILFLILGGLGLYLGSKYIIESTIQISEILKIAPALVAITAIAVGTSLPELVVSVQAAIKGKHEIAIGNVLGSNVFNILAVVGIPALIQNLVIEPKTLTLGIPVLMAATLFFVISGISQRIHRWEGAMYLIIYIFFVGKLFGFI